MLSKPQYCLVARLSQETALSERKIARIAKCSRPSVSKCKSVITDHNLSWQQMEQMDCAELNAKFHPNRLTRSSQKHHPNHAETNDILMANKLLNINHCWFRHCEEEGEHAVGKSTFYEGYRKFRQDQKISMRIEYRGGEIAQVDYAGTVLRYPQKRKLADVVANIFVGVLPCSNYFFAYATPGQTTQDWIDGHIAMFEAWGGVPDTIVTDNAKALVTKANPEKVLNANYEAFSKWYGVAILPAKVRYPKGKAGVENEVGHIKYSILGEMKDMHFSSLKAINAYLKEEVDKLNNKPFQKRNSSRTRDFEKWDKPHLRPLPDKPFKIIELVSKVKVPSDAMILVDEHFYSVPYRYAHKSVEVQVTRNEVRILHDMKQVASHTRSFESGKMTRVSEHMHPNHRYMDDKPVEYYLDWAAEFGESVKQLVEAQFDSPYRNSRRANQACRAIQRLLNDSDLPKSDINQACYYVMTYCKPNPTNLKHTLSSGVYADVATSQPDALLSHSNVRGSGYYDHQPEGRM